MPANSKRIEGLDLARFLALFGMVVVNFNIVMLDPSLPQNGFDFATLLQGKAAALFVVLAGVGLGLGLGAERHDWMTTRTMMVKRAAFLLLIGLANTLVFQADILHYYAFYFLFSLWFLRAKNWVLWVATFGLIIDYVLMVILLDFDKSWDWANYNYEGFWTPVGFIRNLFFNGWHPVIPWFAFLLFGIWLARLNLREKIVQWALIGLGAVIFICVNVASKYIMTAVATIDPELPLLFSTSPVPPLPFYMVAGASFACVVIGLCLCLEPYLRRLGILVIFAKTGRQTLTLYIAHIFIGMGLLQALGKMENQSPNAALVAAIMFCALAIMYSSIWSKHFKRGPLEMIMRKFS